MVEKTWYWDWRSDKAYYPLEVDDDTVTMVSVWHRDEVEGAIEAGALGDVEEVSGEDIGFNHFESFRLPDEADIEALGDGDE